MYFLSWVFEAEHVVKSVWGRDPYLYQMLFSFRTPYKSKFPDSCLCILLVCLFRWLSGSFPRLFIMDKDFHFTLTRGQRTDYSPLYMLWYNANWWICCLVVPLIKSDRQWYSNYHYCSKFHIPYVEWFRVVNRLTASNKKKETNKKQSMGKFN